MEISFRFFRRSAHGSIQMQIVWEMNRDELLNLLFKKFSLIYSAFIEITKLTSSQCFCYLYLHYFDYNLHTRKHIF